MLLYTIFQRLQIVKLTVVLFEHVQNGVFREKSVEKQRPLLICLKHDADKSLLLSQSYLLRGNSQYSDIFIVPDRTKFEREKHKKLVEELKERHSQGPKDLVIRNGVITSKHSRSAN